MQTRDKNEGLYNRCEFYQPVWVFILRYANTGKKFHVYILSCMETRLSANQGARTILVII